MRLLRRGCLVPISGSDLVIKQPWVETNRTGVQLVYYKAVKENDGTYTIRVSKAGGNYEVIRSGVRGCNVARILNCLYRLNG